jgi:hypothetical protein
MYEGASVKADIMMIDHFRLAISSSRLTHDGFGEVAAASRPRVGPLIRQSPVILDQHGIAGDRRPGIGEKSVVSRPRVIREPIGFEVG